MTDLETRLRESLATHAQDAPDAAGLAEGARARFRRRRHTTVGVAALAALAVIAVPVGVAALRDPGRGDRVVTAVDPNASAGTDQGGPAPGWRTETWRDVTLEVPVEWGYGNLSTYCIDGASGELPTPVVERPGGAVESIACLNPAHGYGVVFQSNDTIVVDRVRQEPQRVTDVPGGGESDYPAGAWIGHVSIGQALVTIVAPDQASADRIFDSVRVVTDVDPNGCDVRWGEDRAPTQPSDDSMSVCRYDSQGWLEQSERLDPESAAAAATAIDEAPASGPIPECFAMSAPGVITLSSAGRTADLFLEGSCQYTPSVLLPGDDRRQLTPDVLHWALSPGWSGALPEGVPMPELRH